MTDNFRKECPPRMSDGRFLRDHRQAYNREYAYMKKINATTAHDYKNFLQSNGKKIITTQWEDSRLINSCGGNPPCFHNYPLHSNNQLLNNEMNVYNGVKDSSITELPKCENHKDLSF